jgi:hypothetical protein
VGTSHADREAAFQLEIEAWAAEQAAEAPPFTEEQRAALAPLLDCTRPSLGLRRPPPRPREGGEG